MVEEESQIMCVEGWVRRRLAASYLVKPQSYVRCDSGRQREEPQEQDLCTGQVTQTTEKTRRTQDIQGT